jgi:hypothetical protein
MLFPGFACLIKKWPKSLNGYNFTILLQPQIESSFFYPPETSVKVDLEFGSRALGKTLTPKK